MCKNKLFLGGLIARVMYYANTESATVVRKIVPTLGTRMFALYHGNADVVSLYYLSCKTGPASMRTSTINKVCGSNLDITLDGGWKVPMTSYSELHVFVVAGSCTVETV